MDINHRYFRAGVGTVIYNENGQILLWQRLAYPEGIWQLQQGGIDQGELPEEAKWRELLEETGLGKDDLTDWHEYPHWTVYADNNAINDLEEGRLGQAHQWFFAKLKPAVEIDLTKAHDQEFSAWRWDTFENLIAETSPLKRHVYEALGEYFAKNIHGTL